MTVAEKKIDKLFEELVPPSGKADTVAGEIIRAISRIGYRKYNDGDRIGVGYGKETCNPAARYLMSVCDKDVTDTISAMWGVYSDRVYDTLLAELYKEVLEFVESHPELKTTANEINMWDCATDEDVDYGEDEEDEEW